MDPARFHRKFDHGAFIEKVERGVGIKSDPATTQRILPEDHAEAFIEHYYTKYGIPHLPPFWMVAEILTLGALSLLYSGIGDPALKAQIAQPFGVTAKVLGSWMHSLSHLRNICAHHGRLWNRTFSIAPKIPDHLAATVHAPRRFEGHATVLVEMLRVTAPADDWKKSLRELLVRFPEIDPAAMGFGPSWSTTYWQP
jgi:abortive infection bacteriophage resistance protein